jgi:hypothetical protein
MAQFVSLFEFLEFVKLVWLLDAKDCLVTTEGFDSVERDLEFLSDFRKFKEGIVLVSLSAQESRAHDGLLESDNLLFLNLEVLVKFLLVGFDTRLSLLDSSLNLLVKGTSSLLELNGHSFEFLLEGQDLGLADFSRSGQISVLEADKSGFHVIDFLTLVQKALLVFLGLLDGASELSEISKGVGLSGDVLRNFLNSLLDDRKLGLGALVEVLTEIVHLFSDRVRQVVTEFTSNKLHDTAVEHVVNEVAHLILPLLVLLKLEFDLVNGGVGALEVLKFERNHEFVDITALFSLLGLVLDGVEIFIELGQDALSDGGVAEGVIYYSAESRSGISHEAMDVVLEVGLSGDSVDFFSGASHVRKELLEESSEFGLLGVESHVSLSFIHVEKHGNSDEVLSGGSKSHLLEDLLSTFLVNLNLGFEYHVVDQADVGSERAVVPLGEEK